MRPVFVPGKKKAILFDVYGTLVDRQGSFHRALAMALEEFTARWAGGEWSPEKAAKRFAAAEGKGGASRTQRLRQALSDAPFQVTDDLLRSILKRTDELVPYCPTLCPQAKTVLKALQGSYRLAIISNGKRSRLHTLLDRSGLTAWFANDRVFVSDNPRLKKPGPVLFKRALRTLGVAPGQAVMVGDSWRSDVLGARRAGIDAVWLRGGSGKPRRTVVRGRRVYRASGCKQLLALFETRRP